MNFLAHCALAADAADAWDCTAEERRGLLAGAVLGDFVKGPLFNSSPVAPTAQWPRSLLAGVMLHRRVDALSNHNPTLKASHDLYPPELRRFAPIFTDIIADHCLASSWTRYYELPVEQFSAQCYEAISSHTPAIALTHPVSERLSGFLDYLTATDLLANYHNWSNVSRGLHAVLKRLDRTNLKREVVTHSAEIVAPAQGLFDEYYPQLRGVGMDWNAFAIIAARQNS